MRTVEVTLYQFDELTDKAKDKARAWFRAGEEQMFGSFGEIYEPAETAAKLLGITFNRNDVKLGNGKTRSEPDIRWSGFSSQGDGASFVGEYAYAVGSPRTVRQEFPTDTDLHRIADELAAIQRKNGFKVKADVTCRHSHYSNYSCMEVELSGLSWLDYSDRQGDAEQLSDAVLALMRSFAQWIYHNLEEQYEYIISDENAEESIRANEYDFRDDGTRSDG